MHKIKLIELQLKDWKATMEVAKSDDDYETVRSFEDSIYGLKVALEILKHPSNKVVEYRQDNNEECTCPQGSLCEFFDENEQCQYGKI